MLSIEQLRMARAALNIKQSTVAEAIGVGVMAISDIENERTQNPKASTILSLKTFYEDAGLEFTDCGGVRRNTSSIVKYEGKLGFFNFMDDVYNTIKETPGAYYVSNVDENNWLTWLGEEDAKRRRERTNLLKGVHAKILIKSGDELLTATDYAEYRALPEEVFKDDVSHYIYGDKLALIKFSKDNVVVTVLKNADFAEAQRIWFEVIWNQAIKA